MKRIHPKPKPKLTLETIPEEDEDVEEMPTEFKGQFPGIHGVRTIKTEQATFLNMMDDIRNKRYTLRHVDKSELEDRRKQDENKSKNEQFDIFGPRICRPSPGNNVDLNYDKENIENTSDAPCENNGNLQEIDVVKLTDQHTEIIQENMANNENMVYSSKPDILKDVHENLIQVFKEESSSVQEKHPDTSSKIEIEAACHNLNETLTFEAQNLNESFDTNNPNIDEASDNKIENSIQESNIKQQNREVDSIKSDNGPCSEITHKLASESSELNSILNDNIDCGLHLDDAFAYESEHEIAQILEEPPKNDELLKTGSIGDLNDTLELYDSRVTKQQKCRYCRFLKHIRLGILGRKCFLCDKMTCFRCYTRIPLKYLHSPKHDEHGEIITTTSDAIVRNRLINLCHCCRDSPPNGLQIIPV